MRDPSPDPSGSISAIVAASGSGGTSGVNVDDPPGVDVRDTTEAVLLRAGSAGILWFHDMLPGWLLIEDVSV